MALIELDEVFSIKTESLNYTLLEKVKGFKNVGGERITTNTVKKYYYGTLYQALASYLYHSIDKAESVKGMRKIAISVMNTIDALQAELKEKFGVRGEYRVGPDIIKGEKK